MTPSQVQPDALVLAKRRLLRARCAAGLLVVVAGAWALWPAPAPMIEQVDAKARVSVERPVAVAMQWEAFDAPIWNPTPPPPQPITAAPPPPLRLQLLAIITTEDGAGGKAYAALVYDPDSDTITLVRNGDKVAARFVKSVEVGAIVLAEGTSGTRRLTLETGGAP